MRSGLQVRRHAHVSRFTYRAPSPLERLAFLAPSGQARTLFSAHPSPAAEPPRLEPERIELGSRLPINLRNFLSAQLGPAMRVDDDAIVALRPHSGDLLMRELARAIRRFSAERAREAWSECSIALARLEREVAPVDSRVLFLCLRCACCTPFKDEHRGGDCLVVELGVSGARLSEALQRAIESFRRDRTAAGLPHYDLDCYVAGGQAVFTWRPLPSVA